MRFRTILGLAVLLVVGCAKDNPDTAKNDSPPTKAPASGATTTDQPASGQAQNAPPPSTPPVTAATTKAIVPEGTSATKPPVPGKPVAATATITPAAATAPAQGGLYTFKYAPKEGEVNYKMTTSMDMGNGQPMNMTSTMQNKISKNKDGTYTVVNTTTPPAGFGSGRPMTATSVIDSKGRVVSGGSKSMGASADPMGSSSFSNTLPDHPVKIGDTWNISGGGASKTSMQCKLIKVDDKHGSQIATIEILKMSIPTGGMMTMKLTKPAQIQMDLGTGVALSMNMDAEMSMHLPASSTGTSSASVPKSFKVHMKMEKQ